MTDVATKAARRPRTLGPLVVVVIGYLVVLVALWFASSAPGAVSDAEPTCRGQVMARDAVCRGTRREFVQRTGRISWYTEVEEALTYDEKVAQQDTDAKNVVWFWGMVTGTAGLIVIFAGTAFLLGGRHRRDAVLLGSAALVPLLAATAFVGWSETRFEPAIRPGVFLWRQPEGTAAAIVMLGLVVFGTWATLQAAGVLPDPDDPTPRRSPAAARGPTATPASWAPAPSSPARASPTSLSPAPVRGPTVAGYPLARWWERTLARAVDTLLVCIIVLVISGIVALIIFVVGRPLLGEQTAGTMMRVALPVLAFLLALGYDSQIADPKQAKNSDGNTTGKRMLNLRVVMREPASPGTRPVPEGAAWLRAFVWWAPIFVALFASTGFGLISPIPYAYLLFLLPLLNGAWPLWDRGLRRSLNDRLAKTVVVRTK